MTDALPISADDLLLVAATLGVMSRQPSARRDDYHRLSTVFLCAADKKLISEIVSRVFGGTDTTPAAMERAQL